MIAEGRKIEDAQRDDRNDAGIDQHAEHQPLVHDGEQLPALADESEPLGPWRDESGRRCVHRSAVEFLGMAGMLRRKRRERVDLRNPHGLCHRPGRNERCGLIHGFLGALPKPAFCGALLAVIWAAARPGFATDFVVAPA